MSTRPPSLRADSSINRLPVELLSNIFCFAVLRYKDRVSEFDFSRRALCAVCSLWNTIVVTNPKLWTTIINFVDIPDHCRIAMDRIPLSRDLPLDLILTRYRKVRIYRHEGIYVQRMLALVIPHFQRLRHLHIGVRFSSSLPSVKDHFVRPMPSLVSLTLQCDYDDGPYEEHREFDDFPIIFTMSPQSFPLEKFSCPLLHTMIVDGRNFRYICQERPEWTYDLHNLRKLTVSHFTENEDFDDDHLELKDVVDFLRDLSELSLAFEDVDFHFVPDPFHPPQVSLNNIVSLELRNLHALLLTDLLYHRNLDDLDTVTITDCVLDEPFVFPLVCQELNLEGVGEDAHLSSLLKSWKGIAISFIDCPGFDDAALEILGSTDPDHPSTFTACCRYELLLSGCSNFSIGALKRLVERRNRTVDYTNPCWWRKAEAPALDSIVVEEYGSGLSAADRRWFESHLREFSWDGIGCCRNLY